MFKINFLIFPRRQQGVGVGKTWGLFESPLSIFFIPTKENSLWSYKEMLFSAQYLLLSLNQWLQAWGKSIMSFLRKGKARSFEVHKHADWVFRTQGKDKAEKRGIILPSQMAFSESCRDEGEQVSRRAGQGRASAPTSQVLGSKIAASKGIKAWWFGVQIPGPELLGTTHRSSVTLGSLPNLSVLHSLGCYGEYRSSHQHQERLDPGPP